MTHEQLELFDGAAAITGRHSRHDGPDAHRADVPEDPGKPPQCLHSSSETLPDVGGPKSTGPITEGETKLPTVDSWPEMSFDDLLDGLRTMEGLTLVGGRANFHFKRQPFLHFHEAPEGPYADVRLGSAWEEFGASTSVERHALLALVAEHVATQSRRRPRERRIAEHQRHR